MNAHQTPCVLLSNAPSQYDVGLEAPIQRGVLQERSPNRQSGYLETDHLSQRNRHNASVYTENYYSQVPHNYHGCSRQRYQHNEELRKDREAERLWLRLMQQPGFKKYREKIPKSGKGEGKEAPKWPKHTERAFIRGLVEHPPMGKGKLTLDGKQYGRNELISNYIEKTTGVRRTRKQVSSHIQVLKPLVKGDRSIMQYFLTDKEAAEAIARSPQRLRAGFSRRCPVATATRGQNFHHPQPSNLASQIGGSFLPPVLQSSSANERHGTETFEPQCFQMFVADVQRQPETRFHTFTSFQASPKLPDCQLDSDRLWHARSQFPRLAVLFDSGSTICQMILCEAKIALLPQRTPEGAELKIDFQLATPFYIQGMGGLKVRTTFYDDGFCLNVVNRKVGSDPEHSICKLPFGSEFWAGRIMEWLKVLRDATPEGRPRAEEEVRNSLSRLAAVQEVYFDSDSTVIHPVLLICWRFEQARDRLGETTWRSMIMPEQGAKDILHEPVVSQGFEPIDSEYLQSVSQASDGFSHGTFDLGGLTSDSLNVITTDLAPESVEDVLYSANSVDFDGGHIQMTLDPSVPMEAYNDPAQGFDPYQHGSRTADWTTAYPNLFDQGYHASQGLEQPTGQGAEADDGNFAPQDFSMSPLQHVYSEKGIARGV